MDTTQKPRQETPNRRPPSAEGTPKRTRPKGTNDAQRPARPAGERREKPVSDEQRHARPAQERRQPPAEKTERPKRPAENAERLFNI